MRIKDELSFLKEQDVYSLVLFILYQLHGTKEYSSISELSYVLDKDNLLKLCEFFGGQTITIPTLDEIEELVCGLVLYKHINIDGMEKEKAFNELKGHNTVRMKAGYAKICEYLPKYSFSSR